MSHNNIPATKLLIGMGLIGKALYTGGKSVVHLRRLLVSSGFTNNEISMVFDALRHERLRGVRVMVVQEGSSQIWSLGEIVEF